MTIYDAVRKSIDYIEANLQRDIGVWDVANAVSYSQFYFSRQFSLHTHISIYDYILRRKLSESYLSLFAGKPKIIDVAFTYGFQSHEVYTRAFRKMFGENPSEVSVCKSLLVFDRIGEDYLAFLNGLKVEVLNEDCPDRFFEVDGKADFDSGHCFLMLLEKPHLQGCNTVLQGRLRDREDRFLSFRLRSLKRKLRIHACDARFSMRYFIDHFYDATALTDNFILLNNAQGCIDISVPEKNTP